MISLVMSFMACIQKTYYWVHQMTILLQKQSYQENLWSSVWACSLLWWGFFLGMCELMLPKSAGILTLFVIDITLTWFFSCMVEQVYLPTARHHKLFGTHCICKPSLYYGREKHLSYTPCIYVFPPEWLLVCDARFPDCEKYWSHTFCL